MKKIKYKWEYLVYINNKFVKRFDRISRVEKYIKYFVWKGDEVVVARESKGPFLYGSINMWVYYYVHCNKIARVSIERLGKRVYKHKPISREIKYYVNNIDTVIELANRIVHEEDIKKKDRLIEIFFNYLDRKIKLNISTAKKETEEYDEVYEYVKKEYPTLEEIREELEERIYRGSDRLFGFGQYYWRLFPYYEWYLKLRENENNQI